MTTGRASLGLIVESARRAAAIRSSLRHRQERWEQDFLKPFGFPIWVVARDEVIADPYRAVWQSPMGDEATVLTMPPCELHYPLPILAPPALIPVGALGSLDDRVLAVINWHK